MVYENEIEQRKRKLEDERRKEKREKYRRGKEDAKIKIIDALAHNQANSGLLSLAREYDIPLSVSQKRDCLKRPSSTDLPAMIDTYEKLGDRKNAQRCRKALDDKHEREFLRGVIESYSDG